MKDKHSLTLNNSDHFLSSAAMVSMGLVVDLAKTTVSEQVRQARKNIVSIQLDFFWLNPPSGCACVLATNRINET